MDHDITQGWALAGFDAAPSRPLNSLGSHVSFVLYLLHYCIHGLRLPWFHYLVILLDSK